MTFEVYLNSIKKLAALVGCSPRWLHVLKKRPDFPQKTDDGWPVGEVIQWMLKTNTLKPKTDVHDRP